MSNERRFRPTIAPEVEALSDYMRKRGLDPEGAEGHLVSCSLRWFMGELGIIGNGAFSSALRKAFVNQALFMLAEYDHLREKFEDMKPDGEPEVSDDENR